MSNRIDRKISFVGAGIIAGVLIERLLKTGATSPERILATDIRAGRLAELSGTLGIQVSTENSDAARFGDIIFLAVPPNAVLKVIGELRSGLRADHLLISLAAAVPVASIEEAVGEEAVGEEAVGEKALAVVRVIPNTPSLVGAGMNPHCLGTNVGPAQLALLDELLMLFGETIRIDESLMNIATALTAVGPTYIFPVIKALSEAAAGHGMSDRQAQRAAAQTVLGTAQLVLETGRKPDDLKLMIGTRTIREESAIPMFVEAVDLAFAKIGESQRKLAASPPALAKC